MRMAMKSRTSAFHARERRTGLSSPPYRLCLDDLPFRLIEGIFVKASTSQPCSPYCFFGEKILFSSSPGGRGSKCPGAVIRFDRMLFSAVHYPTDYGFIPETLAEDGDPLDALVLVWEPTFPGCPIEAKPVGLFNMRDEKGRDEKILCVPVHDPLWNYIQTLSDVPPHFLKEMEHFLSIYKELEKKKTEVEGWEDYDAAARVIQESQKRYKRKIPSGRQA